LLQSLTLSDFMMEYVQGSLADCSNIRQLTLDWGDDDGDMTNVFLPMASAATMEKINICWCLGAEDDVSLAAFRNLTHFSCSKLGNRLCDVMLTMEMDKLVSLAIAIYSDHSYTVEKICELFMSQRLNCLERLELDIDCEYDETGLAACGRCIYALLNLRNLRYLELSTPLDGIWCPSFSRLQNLNFLRWRVVEDCPMGTWAEYLKYPGRKLEDLFAVTFAEFVVKPRIEIFLSR